MTDSNTSKTETMGGAGRGNTDSEHFSPYRADGKLYGFVCVVTGASHPIGKAIIAELAAHGAASIYACTTLPLPSSTPSTSSTPTPPTSTQIIPYPHTPTSEQSTLALIDDILNTHGRLDIWITSALSPGPSSITSTSPADVSAVFAANAIPAFLALKYAPAAMQKMCEKGAYPNAAPKDVAYGSIVVVTSVAGGYGGTAYGMAGGAVMGVVRSGVGVLKGSGVRVNAVMVGEIEDGEGEVVRERVEEQRGRIGLERVGRPEEVARAVGFLASGFSSYVTGSEIRCDGGAGVMNPLMAPV